MSTVRRLPSVDELAQIIREEDGSHSLGAGALAERILARLAESPELDSGMNYWDDYRSLQSPLQAHVNGHGFAAGLPEEQALRLHRQSHEKEPWEHGDASHPIPLPRAGRD